MELVRKWPQTTEFTRSQCEFYEDIDENDLPDLRNRAAIWALGRVLSGDEQSATLKSLLDLEIGNSQVPQISPRIELRRGRTGLTYEIFGFGGKRSSTVLYYQGRLDRGVLLEKVTFDSRIDYSSLTQPGRSVN